ncbi:MAG TPA: hypothetical protein VK752_06085 [Bryobacteraceae bacterium]|jgi:hypothetical protein|nr:hypothetical protein [Bryobacteraceae bacterium]
MPDEKDELLGRIESHVRVNLKLHDELRALRPMAMVAQVIARMEADYAKLDQKHHSTVAELIETRASWQKAQRDAAAVSRDSIELRTQIVILEDRLVELGDQRGAPRHGYKQ